MSTPFSVLTNVVYVIVGLYILIKNRRLADWLVGLSFIGLGVASAAYHTFYQPWAQLADERGMYLAFTLLAANAWGYHYGANLKSERIKWNVYMVVGAIIGVILMLIADYPQVDSMYVMPALVLVGLAGIGLYKSWTRALMLFLGFLFIAGIRELPETNFWARDPLFDYDWIHGGWHLFTGLFMLYEWRAPFWRKR